MDKQRNIEAAEPISMTLEYSMSYADWCDYYEAVTPKQYMSPARYYTFVLATNGLLLLFAYFCFLALHQIFIGVIAIFFAVTNLTSAVPFSRIRRKGIEGLASKKTGDRVKLEIVDEGLRETAFDIVSFCPWSSVTKINKSRGVIIAHLTSGLNAAVPVLALESAKMSAEEFIAFLELQRTKHNA